MPIIVLYFRKYYLTTNFSLPTRQLTTSKILMHAVIKERRNYKSKGILSNLCLSTLCISQGFKEKTEGISF